MRTFCSSRGLRAPFIEIAPRRILAFGVEETIVDALEEGSGAAAVFGALRRGEGGPARFALSLAEAHAHGVALDWEAVLAGVGRGAGLAATLCRRERWDDALAPGSDPRALGQRPLAHPLLSAAISTASGELLLPGASRASPSSGLPRTRSWMLPCCRRPPCSTWRSPRPPTPPPAAAAPSRRRGPLARAGGGRGSVAGRAWYAGGEGERSLAITRAPAGTGRRRPSGRAWPPRRFRGRRSRCRIASRPGRPRASEGLAVEEVHRRIDEREAEWSSGLARLEAAWREDDRIHAGLLARPGPGGEAGASAFHPALLQLALQVGVSALPALQRARSSCSPLAPASRCRPRP